MGLSGFRRIVFRVPLMGFSGLRAPPVLVVPLHTLTVLVHWYFTFSLPPLYIYISWSHFLFLAPLIISCPLFWTDITCLSSVMVHPSSHINPNDMNGSVFVFETMWICLAFFLRPGSLSVVICEDSIVLPSGSLAVI